MRDSAFLCSFHMETERVLRVARIEGVVAPVTGICLVTGATCYRRRGPDRVITLPAGNRRVIVISCPGGRMFIATAATLRVLADELREGHLHAVDVVRPVVPRPEAYLAKNAGLVWRGQVL